MHWLSRRTAINVQLVIAAVCVSWTASVEIPTDLENLDIDKIKESIPTDLLPPELSEIALPSMKEMLQIVKDKCTRAAGSDAAYEAAQQAGQKLSDCLKELVDFSDLENEIQLAKPTGDLDTVFNKYCRRRSAAIECINTFSKEIDVCLENDERESKQTMVNILHGLLNFVCHKDGDQIALFIAEEGPECFKDQKQPLLDCFNTTLKDYMDETVPKPTDSIPKLVMGKKQCDEMDMLRDCFVLVLEDCKESTPANLVESLFKFVKKETPCANFTAPAGARQHNSSDFSRASVHVILTTWLLTLLAKVIVQ